MLLPALAFLELRVTCTQCTDRTTEKEEQEEASLAHMQQAFSKNVSPYVTFGRWTLMSGSAFGHIRARAHSLTHTHIAAGMYVCV